MIRRPPRSTLFPYTNALPISSQDTGTFEEMISSSMTAPVVGSLAGNVLKRFRVDLDYPNQKLYLTGP